MSNQHADILRNVRMHPSKTLYTTSTNPPRFHRHYGTPEGVEGSDERLQWESEKATKKAKWDLTRANNKSTGIRSQITRNAISLSIDYTFCIAPVKTMINSRTGQPFKYKVGWGTLDLPSEQIHTDQEITQQCLNPFLQAMHRRFKAKHITWVSESQANGNIHYHFITDVYIPHQDLRDLWNYYIERLGYCTRYREAQQLWHRDGFHYRPELQPAKNRLKQFDKYNKSTNSKLTFEAWSHLVQLDAYHAGVLHDWSSPNDTDIHAVYDADTVASYISKYCTKKAKHRPITGRTWGSTITKKQREGAQFLEDGGITSEKIRCLHSPSVKVYATDRFSVHTVPAQSMLALGCPLHYAEFCSYMKKNFDHDMQTILYT
jgi:hypothetical protein